MIFRGSESGKARAKMPARKAVRPPVAAAGRSRNVKRFIPIGGCAARGVRGWVGDVARQVASRTRRPPAPAGDLILASKITVPGVPDWTVPRPRITKLIAEGVRWCPLTVVTGPAGAGKTMALASWAAAEPGPVAWVGLDGYDNAPRVFWPYVVAALGGAGVSSAPALPGGRAGADGGPGVPAAAGVGAGGPGPAGDAGPG